MAQKRGRPRAGQERLTSAKILTAALALADSEGLKAVNMRRLAALLGVDPMALYRYFPSKAALFAELVDLAFVELDVQAAAGSSWQDRVRSFAAAYRRLARAHPDLIFHAVTEPAAGARGALAAGEHLYRALLDAGLPPQHVVWAADLIMDLLIGFTLGETSGRVGLPNERSELLKLLDAPSSAAYPAMRQVFRALTTGETTSSFEAELGIVLAGIETLLDAGPQPPVA